MRVQPKKIICATDFSDLSNRTVPYGIGLAREFGAKLYMCHVINLLHATMYGEDRVDFAERKKSRIMNYIHEQFERLIGAEDVDWEPLVATGSIVNEISREVEEKDVDLVISATHSRSGLKRVVLGSVTERLMQTLSCSLLVVRSLGHDFVTPADQKIRLQRILVGCDFSPDSSMAFQYGLSLAQEFQSELHLAHVIEPRHYKDLLKAVAESERKLQPDLRDQLSERLAEMITEEARIWCTPKTALLAGQPYKELIEYAVLHNIDLIVLGVRGYGLAERLFVGSTTDRVVRQAQCPVLSVCS